MRYARHFKHAVIGCMLLLGSLLPMAAQGIFSSGYNISRLDLSSGLPHSNVNHIFADSRGFIWVSTYGGGAVRYDGFSFVRPIADGGRQVVSNSCKGFAEDRHQRRKLNSSLT